MYDLYSFENGNPIRSANFPTIREKICKSSLVPSRLPGLNYALNPYRGCEHGCLYCYGPSVLKLKRGSWATEIEVKINLPDILRREIVNKTGIVGIGTVTDPYQPIERNYCITRKSLEIISRSELKASILTKSDLILRDADLISRMCGAEAGITITTIDDDFASQFEPHAPPPSKRIETLKKLSELEIDTYAMIGPILPIVTEDRLGALISEIASTGTKRVMVDKLRLRPDMMETLISCDLMEDSHFKEEFLNKARSNSFYQRIQREIFGLCKKNQIHFERAF
ncbi:MAG: radical SAM protein [Methanomassiliicoccales archaeon]|jgi:DNA repair photolyase|nr:radical SAM protein [Methanomassiliicoccales archaeon]